MQNNLHFDLNNANHVTSLSFTKFGGTREADNLVIYSSIDYPSGSLTNQYGYEAAVSSEGLIVQMDANVEMPKDGYVISGHGVMDKLVRNKLCIGQYIALDKENLKLEVYESETFSICYEIMLLNDKTKTKVTEMVASMYDFNIERVKSLQVEVENMIKSLLIEYENYKVNPVERELSLIKGLASSIKTLIKDINYLSYPNFKVEGRFAWHRPNSGKGYDEYTLEGIQKMLDQIKKMGIQTLLVETFWEGFVSYASKILPYQLQLKKDGTIPTYGEYGQDYLKCIIGEAHKRDIKIHAWTETFLAGVAGENQVGLAKHINNEWLNVNYFGVAGEKCNHAILYYFDPANPEVLGLLESAYIELTKNYDLDGIELDYIRYPYSNISIYDSENLSNLNDSGYTEFAMKDFMNQYKYDGELKNLIKDSKEVRNQWIDYRAQKVTDAIEKFRSAILKEKPNMIITIAVAADYKSGYTSYCQNWPKWSKNGWIDSVKPMAYTSDTTYVGDLTKSYVDLVESKSLIYTGIGPVYYSYPISYNQDQMTNAVLKGGAGSCIFATLNILGNPEFERALELSVSYLSRISPENDDLQAILEEGIAHILDKIKRIYNRNHEFNNLEVVQDLLNQIKEYNTYKFNDLKEIIAKLNQVLVILDKTSNVVIKQRMTEDILYIRRLFDFYMFKLNKAL